MGNRRVRVSKRLSLVLRHSPQRIGITLDSGGWVSIDVLLAALGTHGLEVSKEELLDLVERSDKQRFAIREGRIRANQGHSIPVDLDLVAQNPPSTLFHGTAQRFLSVIEAQGLRPMARHHVHLSADVSSAKTVGKRHGKLVVLVVDAAQMASDGHTFFRSENGVWLTVHVAPAYLRRHSE